VVVRQDQAVAAIDEARTRRAFLEALRNARAAAAAEELLRGSLGTTRVRSR